VEWTGAYGGVNRLTSIVIIPAYNERDNLSRLLPSIFQYQEFDILVIDDYTGDGTPELLKNMKRVYGERLNFIVRRGKRGYTSALKEGYRYALETGYKYIFQMDADLQHDPRYLNPLLEEVRRGYGLVIASRYVDAGGVQGWPLHRRVISIVANVYARTVLGIPAKDLTSGYRVFSGETLSSIVDNISLSKGFFIQVETAYLTHRCGYRLSEIPFIFKARERGSSKLDIMKIIEFFINVLRLRYSGDGGGNCIHTTKA